MAILRMPRNRASTVRSQSRDLTRSAGSAPARSRVIGVAYDGERTEDEYFRGWSRIIGNAGLVLSPFYVKSGGNALNAIKEAQKLKMSDGPFDELYCVCDVDDTTAEGVNKARKFAIAQGITLCLSRRSFEVWLALHWDKISLAPLNSEQDAVQLVCAKHTAYSARKKVVPFSELFPRTAAAIANAQWLASAGTDNPSTEVHIIVERLLKLHLRQKARFGSPLK